MKPEKDLCQQCRVNEVEGVLSIIGLEWVKVRMIGATHPRLSAQKSNVATVVVPRDEVGVAAVCCDTGPEWRTHLLRLYWEKDKLCFDGQWCFLPPPDRQAVFNKHGIDIVCGEERYYAPSPIQYQSREPRPGESIISCDDACLFLGEKITKDQLDDRIRQRIAQEDRMAELQQRLETAESQRQDEVAARHADWRKFELEFARIVLQKDDEKAKHGEQLQSKFDRTPVWRLAGQRFNAWRKDSRQWLKDQWPISFFTRRGR